VWLVAIIEKFPKSHKFTIGDRIEITALDMLHACCVGQPRRKGAVVLGAGVGFGRYQLQSTANVSTGVKE
jgi:hypothetical protein